MSQVQTTSKQQPKVNSAQQSSTVHGGDVRVQTNTGETFIPATQRPDGTWRKERRVKAGYVPQDEQPRFECRAQAELRQRSAKSGGAAAVNFPVGWCPVAMAKSAAKSPVAATAQQNGPVGRPVPAVLKANALITPQDHVRKQITKLAKKIEEIDKLDEKIKSGALAKPEQTQLDKIGRRGDIEREMDELSAQLAGQQL